MNTWLEIGLSNALVATALAAVAWSVGRIRRRPELAFVLWLLVLAKLVTPPVWSVPWPQPAVAWIDRAVADAPSRVLDGVAKDNPAPARDDLSAHSAGDARTMVAPVTPTDAARPAEPAESSPAVGRAGLVADQPATEGRGAAFPRWSWSSFVGYLWLTGSTLWLTLAAVRILGFARLVRRAEPAPEAIQREVRSLAAQLGLRRVPDVRLMRRQTPPLVWAFTGRGTVLLPCDLWEDLSHDERTTLLAHELAHLERRAYLVRWLELAALGLYWWLPVTWWARRHLEAAEEQSCDARVVGLLPALARDYATALLHTVEFLSDSRPAIPLGARGFSQRQLLRRRMEMILAGTKTRRVRWPLRLALAAAAVVVLPLSMHTAAAQKPETVQRVKAATKGMNVEQRLARLELAVQELIDEMRADRKADVAASAPTVVTTVPATGEENVDPNLAEIKVTFNKKMKNNNWSWVTLVKEEFPETTGGPAYDTEQRTCTLPVKLEPGKKYTIGINSSKFANFKDMSGRPAVPYLLEFQTKPQLAELIVVQRAGRRSPLDATFRPGPTGLPLDI